MLRFLTVALLLAAPIFAADIDGKWTGVVYNFNADGATLRVPPSGPTAWRSTLRWKD